MEVGTEKKRIELCDGKDFTKRNDFLAKSHGCVAETVYGRLG